MIGEELKEIAGKYKKMEKGFWGDVPTILENYNWNAIAAAITPKPLTIEELVEMLSSSCPIPVDLREGHRRIDNEWKLSKGFCTVWGPLDLQKLLDLINNKRNNVCC